MNAEILALEPSF